MASCTLAATEMVRSTVFVVVFDAAFVAFVSAAAGEVGDVGWVQLSVPKQVTNAKADNIVKFRRFMVFIMT